MRRLVYFLAAVSFAPNAVPGTVANAQNGDRAQPAPRTSPVLGSFGFDREGMDLSVAPGDDFYAYANGNWVRSTALPADRAIVHARGLLNDRAEERALEIIRESARTSGAPGSEAQKIGDYYASFVDTAAIEARGAAPLDRDLAPFRNARNRSELARALGRSRFGFGPALVYLDISIDDRNPNATIPYLQQGGLGLPNRDYYLLNDANIVQARSAYIEHLGRMLALLGVPANQSGDRARRVFEFERQIAEVHWNGADSRDAEKIYNKISRANLVADAPGFDWDAFLDGAGIEARTDLLVAQPSALTGTARIFAATPLAVLQDWAVIHAAKDAAAVLPSAFDNEQFAFRRAVFGQQQLAPRWRRGVAAVDAALGEAIGKIYVERYFRPDARARVQDMAQNLNAAMDARLAQLSWMTPETRARARAKLANSTLKIGYPETWRDYSGLEVVRGDAYGNRTRAMALEWRAELAKLGRPVDRSRWVMNPQTPNAYATWALNEIVFPAGIFQEPFFDPNADPAVNYGAMGMVIGHEISHHFDDQGRQYDENGRLADWWTPADVARFRLLASRLEAQYSSYEPLPGVRADGARTLSENIADLAGLTVAYEAYRRSLGGREAPVIDGLTGDQRFFLGFAQIWRAKLRDEETRRRLATDDHSLPSLRVATVRNFDPWYAAFNVRPGQRLYLPPEARVQIW